MSTEGGKIVLGKEEKKEKEVPTFS